MTDFSELLRDCHERGWTLATSGNFSLVTQRNPLRLEVTPSGVDKLKLSKTALVGVDGETGLPLDGRKKPSEETLLHVMVARHTEAGAIVHIHSVWNTLLSDRFAGEGGFTLSGYEMLKGLSSVKTHEHREWIPIFENSQNIPDLANQIKQLLIEKPSVHAFLLRKHGLYTWGKDLEEAKRHLEVFEFLFEAEGRLPFK